MVQCLGDLVISIGAARRGIQVATYFEHGVGVCDSRALGTEAVRRAGLGVGAARRGIQLAEYCEHGMGLRSVW